MNEAAYWRQRYEMLMANFSDAVKTAIVANTTPRILADAESFEAGRVMEREACAQICAQKAKDFQDLFEKYGYEEDEGAMKIALRCEGLIRARGKQ